MVGLCVVSLQNKIEKQTFDVEMLDVKQKLKKMNAKHLFENINAKIGEKNFLKPPG